MGQEMLHRKQETRDTIVGYWERQEVQKRPSLASQAVKEMAGKLILARFC